MTSKITHPDVGRRLAAVRLQRGFSQGAVARRAGIAPSYLSRLETGKVHPTFRMVARIAGALRIPMEELVATAASSKPRRGGCPVTKGGHCLLDLIRSERQARRPGEEAFSPREIRLLQRLADWMQGASAERLRAMEIVLEEFTRRGEPRRA
jgi:transcriptional regulator with XRE-family HTH domain